MSIPSFDSPVVIHWFRRDLRWQDNRALHAALTSGLPVVPMFVFDKNILDRLDSTADARVTFLHDRISQLQKEASEHGGALFVTHGDPVEVLAALAASEARLPATDRQRVLLHERRARLVRMRMFRAKLDSMAKAPRDKNMYPLSSSFLLLRRAPSSPPRTVWMNRGEGVQGVEAVLV